MRHIASTLGMAALLVTAAFAQTGSQVDPADTPKKDILRTATCTQTDSAACAQKWTDAENRFMSCLSAGEKTNYQEMKQLFEQTRTRLQAFKDSVKNLSVESRTQAIAAKKAQIETQVQQLESQIQSRLATMEQKQARAAHKAEVAKKRELVKKHLEEVKAKIQSQVSGN